MKNFFHTPKLAIPTVGAVILLLGALMYSFVGIAPAINPTLTTTDALSTSTRDINLAFAKAGRVESILVKEGDVVKKGQELARLSAPDAVGAIRQAQGALELARAQYASLNVQYVNAEKQQNQIVANAYQTLLSSNLEATPDRQNPNPPQITGTYTCGKEGSYILAPYPSNEGNSGYSIEYSGLEGGKIPVTYDSPTALGSCGLFVKFPTGNYFDAHTVWTISIPNQKSAQYVTNKNTYSLALTTREKTLSDLAVTLGKDTQNGGVAQAQVQAAEGAYEAALGIYQNSIIISPFDGVISAIDADLKPGQSIAAAKGVITVSPNR